jgi:hypothetical protein
MQEAPVLLWEVATGKEVRRFRGQRYVESLVFSADGRALAGGGEWTARVWEVATGLERRRFGPHQGPIRAIALSPDGTRLAAASQDTTTLVWDVTSLAGAAPALTDRQRQRCWDDLAGSDGPRSATALWSLVADPRRSLPFLRGLLKPARAAGADQVARLIADLDSRTFVVRRDAQKAIEELGEPAAPALRQALQKPRSAEQRRHLEELLEKAVSLSPERLREVRAVEALEHMGTAEARELLAELAGGADASLTREACASKDRLTARLRSP